MTLAGSRGTRQPSTGRVARTSQGAYARFGRAACPRSSSSVWDLHEPRQVPRSFQGRALSRTVYDRALAALDLRLAELFPDGSLDDVNVCLVGDHGENLRFEPRGKVRQGRCFAPVVEADQVGRAAGCPTRDRPRGSAAPRNAPSGSPPGADHPRPSPLPSRSSACRSSSQGPRSSPAPRTLSCHTSIWHRRLPRWPARSFRRRGGARTAGRRRRRSRASHRSRDGWVTALQGVPQMGLRTPRWKYMEVVGGAAPRCSTSRATFRAAQRRQGVPGRRASLPGRAPRDGGPTHASESTCPRKNLRFVEGRLKDLGYLE